MPVLQADHDRYYAFVEAEIHKLKCFDVDEQLLWHYTTGDALISIIESGTLFATQVSCLNDGTEIRYGSDLLRDAYLDLISEVGAQVGAEENEIRLVLEKYALASREDSAVPSNAPSHWFVACFSKKCDDLSQWRAYGGAENGYAIGFRTSALFEQGIVARVNYDKEQHKLVATELAKATFSFLRDGIETKRATSTEQWTAEFLSAWRMWVDHLSPMVKHPSFSAEDEYRIILQLKGNDIPRLQFRQKATLMSRHIPMSFAGFPLLPIAGVKIGPSRHKEITAFSVDTLLRKKGYGPGLVSLSEVPFQLT